MILYLDYIIQIIFILLLSYSSTKESIRSANYSVDIYVTVYPSYISLWKICPPLISHWPQINKIVIYKLHQSSNSQIITLSPGISMDIWHTVTLSRWRHQMETFKRYWPFLRGIHRSPMNFQQKGQWSGALMFSLICVWIHSCVNNSETGDWRRHRAHYDVTVMSM